MSQFIVERALAPAEGDAAQLFILFVSPEQVELQANALVSTLAQTFPASVIVIIVPKPDAEADSAMHKILADEALSDDELCDFAFAVSGECEHLIMHLQERFSVSREATAIVATKQLASAILELTKLPTPLAGRVFSFGGRYAELPNAKLSLDQTVHFLHAGKDPLIPVHHTRAADMAFAEFEGDATIDVGHAMEDSFHPELVEKMIERLLTCVPLRYWLEAQGMRPSQEGGQGEDEGTEGGLKVDDTGPGRDDSVH